MCIAVSINVSVDLNNNSDSGSRLPLLNSSLLIRLLVVSTLLFLALLLPSGFLRSAGMPQSYEESGILAYTTQDHRLAQSRWSDLRCRVLGIRYCSDSSRSRLYRIRWTLHTYFWPLCRCTGSSVCLPRSHQFAKHQVAGQNHNLVHCLPRRCFDHLCHCFACHLRQPPYCYLRFYRRQRDIRLDPYRIFLLVRFPLRLME